MFLKALDIITKATYSSDMLAAQLRMFCMFRTKPRAQLRMFLQLCSDHIDLVVWDASVGFPVVSAHFAWQAAKELSDDENITEPAL
jgi:hypothetical protein